MTDPFQNWLESLSKLQLMLFYVALVFVVCLVGYGVARIPSGPPWTPPPPATRTVVAEDDWSITYKITDYDLGQTSDGSWVPTSTYSTVEKVRSSK